MYGDHGRPGLTAAACRGRGARTAVTIIGILMLLLSACSGSPKPASATVGSGSGQATLDRTRVELVDSTATVTITTQRLTGAPDTALRSITGLPFAAGMPTDVRVDEELPSGGVRITRSYARPLPAEATATLAYFSETLGAWVAVPSTVAEDRRSVTATVHHLSWWTDLVSAGQQAWQQTTQVIGEAADWAYYQVGNVFDVRVDSPECTAGSPAWVSSVTVIDANRNNPVLFCTGIDGRNASLLVVKARVNRGFGLDAVVPAGAQWSYNSTYEGSPPIEETLTTLGDIGSVFADSFRDLTAGGLMVGPGQELSLGVAEAGVRTTNDGVVLRLEPQSVQAFLFTTLGTLVGADLTGRSDGYVAAVIALAACAKDTSEAHDGGTLARAGLTCVSGVEETVAHKLGDYLSKRGVTNAGKVAGTIVAKITIYLGLVGPVFNGMQYFAELNTDPGARTVTVFPQTVPTVLGVPQDHIIDASGEIKDGLDSVGFATPSGALICSMTLGQFDTPSTARCQGGWMPDRTGPDKDYCAATHLGIAGAYLDFQAGWLCAGGVVVASSAAQQEWWAGRGFPTVSAITGGGQAVLPEGWGLKVGQVICVSLSNGVTCKNMATEAAFHTESTATTFSGPQHKVWGDGWAS